MDKDIVMKEDRKVSQSPLTVFVATLPDRFNRSSACLVEAEKIPDIILLHPYYDFNTETGIKTLETIGDVVPTYRDAWENIMRKDFFCVEKSDIVIFDLDTKDINHYLAVAACYNKPIVAVSSNLLSVPVYFSGSVICIVKPNQIAKILKLASEDSNFLTLPQAIYPETTPTPTETSSEEGEKKCET